MKARLAILLGIIATFIVIAVECCKTSDNDTATAEANSYTGNQSCKSCHAAEHAQWEKSHHYMAMQPANDSTVLGNFNNQTFTADGVTTRFFKKDGKFMINTEGEDGQSHDYEVKYIFGFTPLQQYLIEFPGGRMQATRVSWDVIAKKWFHQMAGDKIPAGDWLHWTGNGQNWNTMCAGCHSTNVKKGYDPVTDTYHTTYNDINVSCESCHGPGKKHIDYIASGDYKDGKKQTGSLLQLYKASGQMAEINTCGYCHARRVDITENGTPATDVMNDYIPALPTNDFFFADGQMNDEDYNYTSFLQSKMFHRGVQCSNCHNPHSGELKLNNSLVCGQCHDQTKYTAQSHTLHPANLLEVNCVSCHMPSKLYMGNDRRHDHSFRIPRPDLTVQYGTPNTCNSCHANKSAQWAADKIAAQFGAVRKHHFSDDLVPGSLLNSNSEAHLNKLLADTATPQIVRAATLHYLAELGSASSATTLAQYSNDANAMVRYAALSGLKNYPASVWLQTASGLLQDTVRAVRIAAGDLFMTIPATQIPANVYDAFSRAKGELENFLIFQTDFAVGNLQAGDYYRKQNDLVSAEKYYRRAIAKDSQMAIARVNLASTLNATGKNTEALQQLQVASKLEPASDHIFYTLGLIYAELKDYEKAGKSLQRSIALNKQNIRAQYNYGLLLQQQGQYAAAEKVYTTALNIDASNGDLLNALTILYLQTQQMNKAVATGKLLQQYHGGDPAYSSTLRQLRLQ
ncbi:MAG TPA: tetratricopeptide repeat protein [Phnomibacter sp.]|nr:tetratricopeptide repeat protein [Phnomibacter sp.]